MKMQHFIAKSQKKYWSYFHIRRNWQHTNVKNSFWKCLYLSYKRHFQSIYCLFFLFLSVQISHDTPGPLMWKRIELFLLQQTERGPHRRHPLWDSALHLYRQDANVIEIRAILFKARFWREVWFTRDDRTGWFGRLSSLLQYDSVDIGVLFY